MGIISFKPGLLPKVIRWKSRRICKFYIWATTSVYFAHTFDLIHLLLLKYVDWSVLLPSTGIVALIKEVDVWMESDFKIFITHFKF